MCLTEKGDFCLELLTRLVIFFGMAALIITASDWIPFLLNYFDNLF